MPIPQYQIATERMFQHRYLRRTHRRYQCQFDRQPRRVAARMQHPRPRTLWAKAVEALEMVGTSVDPSAPGDHFSEAGQRLYVGPRISDGRLDFSQSATVAAIESASREIGTHTSVVIARVPGLTCSPAKYAL